MSFLIIFGSATFAQVLAFTGASSGLIKFFLAFDLTPMGLMLVMIGIIFFLGCFMDQLSMMMLTAPIFFPLAKALGFDLTWFGLIMLLALEIGYTTPPFGLLLFVMKGVAPPGTTMMDVYKAAAPFIACSLLLIVHDPAVSAAGDLAAAGVALIARGERKLTAKNHRPVLVVPQPVFVPGNAGRAAARTRFRCRGALAPGAAAGGARRTGLLQPRQPEARQVHPPRLATPRRDAGPAACMADRPTRIVQDMQTYQVAAEQPYIHRLTRLGVEAEARGRGIEFAREASALIFGGTRDWHLGGHLAQAAQRAGLDLAAMDAAIASPDAMHAAEIEANQQALAAAGHWGVPTFVLDGEPFFGEDRIDTAALALGQDRAAARLTPAHASARGPGSHRLGG